MPSISAPNQVTSNRRYSLGSDVTEENPFSQRELCIFVGIYSFCVIFLICVYEYLMPVINNPTYPYYNYVPDYTFKSRNNQ